MTTIQSTAVHQIAATSGTATAAGTCPLCGAELHNPRACDRCDWVEGYGQPPAAFQRNPRDKFAFILSLFWPGAGHLYKGQYGWGLCGIGLGVLCFLWAITFLMFGGFLIFPACWLFFAIDAYFRKDLRHLNDPVRPAA